MNSLRNSKYINLFSAGASCLLSSFLHKPVMKGMPAALNIELTNHCNLHCPECPSGSGMATREKGFMDPEFFRFIMKEAGDFLLHANLYFQGEPMIHPQFFSFTEHNKGIYTTVSTNGHFLSEENSNRIVSSGLNELIISLDGLTQDIYASYRVNGKVSVVLEGIRNISEAKKRSGSAIRIRIQVLVNKFNESQVPELRELAEQSGASLYLKSMQVYNEESINKWLPSGNRFNRYKLKDGKYIIKCGLPRRCPRLWFNPVITWDGLVLPCCFDKDAEYVMGDLKKNSFREIWYGERFMNFRKNILTGREKIGICNNCTSSLRGVNT